MSNPLEPHPQNESSRLIEQIDRQRLEKSRTESVIQLIQYHAKAMHLNAPLYTAKSQQETLQKEKTLQGKGTKGQKLSKEDLKAFAPLIFKQVDDYEGLVRNLLACNLPKGEKETLDQMLNQLLAMQKKGHLDPEDLKKLTEIIQTLNRDVATKLSPEESKQHWAQVASMYSEMEEMTKKQKKKAKTKEGKNLMNNLGNSVGQDKNIADAKAQGHETLAQMFIEAILGKFMPKAEAQLEAIALLLQFQNWGATALDDLLGMINDFGASLNDFNLSTFLQGGKGGVYPNGQDIKNGWDKERNACARDLNELQQLKNGLNDKISDINKQLKTATDPKVIAGLKKLKGQLQDQLGSCDTAGNNLNNLQKIIGGPGDPPKPHGTMTVVVSGGKATVTGTAGPKGSKGLSAAENAVVSGDVDHDGAGGLQTIYNDLKGDQQDYSNQSSTQQMQLQLTMTEVQQMWTIVSTCMTTLNQSVMTLAQSIYK